MIQQRIDKLSYYVCENRHEMGRTAAALAAERIKQALSKKEEVRIIFAAAPSQLEFIDELTSDSSIDWSRIIGFHMDEYIGLTNYKDQRFAVFIKENIADKVNMKDMHYFDTLADPEEETIRYTRLLQEAPIDLVCLGIGENGHIAFNDPPVADFNDVKLVKQVELDQTCKQQQVNDGCFPTIDEVPKMAWTLTIPALVSSKSMVCVVPGERKAQAVYHMLKGEISTACPASILRIHSDAHLVMDREAFGVVNDGK
ncbi:MULTISPECIES: glucosamine-6-phosphate deaminase [Gracilibacillus]|uniref:glucosamine-6-phosphate deaminase n=1 Tax=Gracilibacillus TaxID=74385 RepID=UPI000824210E|nr:MULTISPECIES: glucosamine-6-phosphate deaminase [Gracilibacillus]